MLVIFRLEQNHFCVKNRKAFLTLVSLFQLNRSSGNGDAGLRRHLFSRPFTINIFSFTYCVFTSVSVTSNIKITFWQVKKYKLAFRFWLVFFGRNFWNISGFSVIMDWRVTEPWQDAVLNETFRPQRSHQTDSLTSEDASMPAWDISSATFFSRSLMRRPIWSSVQVRESSALHFSWCLFSIQIIWLLKNQQLLFNFEGVNIKPEVDKDRDKRRI